jgi:hypothetical protein
MQVCQLLVFAFPLHYLLFYNRGWGWERWVGMFNIVHDDDDDDEGLFGCDIFSCLLLSKCNTYIKYFMFDKLLKLLELQKRVSAGNVDSHDQL